MKLTFLGTGISMGIPIAGHTDNHYSNDPRDTRLRSSIWIKDKTTSIVIDIGPDFRQQALRAGITHIDTVLISHCHTDHIAGVEELRPYTFDDKGTLPIYTNASCKDMLMRRYFHLFTKSSSKNIALLTIKTMYKPLLIGDINVIPLPVEHADVETHGFKINDVCYVSDVKTIPHETAKLMYGSKILILGSVGWDQQHKNHINMIEGIKWAQQHHIEQVYFTHIGPSILHQEIQKKLPPNMFLAFDQLEIEV